MTKEEKWLTELNHLAQKWTEHPISLLGYSWERKGWDFLDFFDAMQVWQSSWLLLFRLLKAEEILVDTPERVLLFICITACHVQTLSKHGWR